jgi:hypothetical protein
MRKRVISYVQALAAGLCTVIAFSTNGALAAGDCVVHPNRQPAQDGHWYYRVDRVSYRKCWYLVEPRTSIPQAEPTAARPSPDSALQQTFSSFISLVSADFTGAKPAGALQDGTNSDVHALQTRPDELRNGDATWVKRARIARHPDSNTGVTPKLNRQSPTGPHVGRMDQPPTLDEVERNALFQEFLQWNARQTP